MKFFGSLLALCVLHANVWGTVGFFPQASKPLTPKTALWSSYMDSLPGPPGQPPGRPGGAPGGTGPPGRGPGAPGAPGAPGSGPGAPGAPGSGPGAVGSGPGAPGSGPGQPPGRGPGAGPGQPPGRGPGAAAGPGAPGRGPGAPGSGPAGQPPGRGPGAGPGAGPPPKPPMNKNSSPPPKTAVREPPRNAQVAERPPPPRDRPQRESAVAKAAPPRPRPEGGSARDVKEIWDSITPTKVQGNSLRTWSFASPMVERVQVLAKTEGRPLNANIELWQGPDNCPQKMGLYVEDGRPFSTVIATPRGSNAVAVRNTGPLEFPFNAAVEADSDTIGLEDVVMSLAERSEPRIVQGGAVHTYPFSPYVESVQIMLTTDGRPLNARIELLQGPNNIKQVMEIYTEDGMDRPFFAVIESSGTGNVIRIVNTATVEFPLSAYVEPYMVQPGTRPDEALVGTITGGSGGGGNRPIW